MYKIHLKFENIISGIEFNNEQYHQKLKHSCNFNKKQRSKTNVFVIKLYIRLTVLSFWWYYSYLKLYELTLALLPCMGFDNKFKINLFLEHFSEALWECTRFLRFTFFFTNSCIYLNYCIGPSLSLEMLGEQYIPEAVFH